MQIEVGPQIENNKQADQLFLATAESGSFFHIEFEEGGFADWDDDRRTTGTSRINFIADSPFLEHAALFEHLVLCCVIAFQSDNPVIWSQINLSYARKYIPNKIQVTHV